MTESSHQRNNGSYPSMPAQDVMEIEQSHVQGAVLDEVALGQGAGEWHGLAPDAECRFDADLRVIRGRLQTAVPTSALAASRLCPDSPARRS